MPEWLVNRLAPWDLPRLEDYRSELLSGFQTERYGIDLREGFEKARAIMDAEIRRLCCRDIGGNHQRLHSVHTQHVGITFKHILLPIWLAAYRYHDKTYQILVNGRSGKVVGTRPYSWIKITLLVVVIAALLGAILWLFASRAHGGPVQPAKEHSLFIHPALRINGDRYDESWHRMAGGSGRLPERAATGRADPAPRV
jgi:hypothetical protein